MRPPIFSCGSDSNMYIIFCPPRNARLGIMKMIIPAGSLTKNFRWLPAVPYSSMATLTFGSSVSRLASTHPAAPPPTIT